MLLVALVLLGGCTGSYYDGMLYDKMSFKYILLAITVQYSDNNIIICIKPYTELQMCYCIYA